MPHRDSMNTQHIGVEIGGYRITQMLGQGGMGVVYEATHSAINLRCAIKALRPQFLDAEVGRFRDEARALATVSHSSLVRLYDVGSLPDGTIYIQMELLAGETLSERLRRLGGPLPLMSALELGRQVASALSVVHAHGIVHRDLKPSNVFLVSDMEAPDGERAKILDFGIAKFRGREHSTGSGHLLGTPRYMSPEQCEAGPYLDGRADVYSLGILLFEMLTGELPYDVRSEEPLAWLYVHIEKRPRRVLDLLPHVPIELSQLVAEMLDKVPAQRPTMSQVEQRLRSCLALVGGDGGRIPPENTAIERQGGPGPPPRNWLRYAGLLGLIASLWFLVWRIPSVRAWMQTSTVFESIHADDAYATLKFASIFLLKFCVTTICAIMVGAGWVKAFRLVARQLRQHFKHDDLKVLGSDRPSAPP